MRTTYLLDDFHRLYGEFPDDPRIFFSPGRVNLIGEHTDYNGGYVFPCALTFGTFLVARKNNLSEVRFASQNFDYTATIPLDRLTEKKGNTWINYPLGVIDEFDKIGLRPETGMDILYYGNIPNGAGLSSSASIETVTAFMFDQIFGNGDMDLRELALLCQRAENNFVGVNCGIMDQYAVSFGKMNHAIFLNCDTVEHELVPLNLEGLKLIVSNTNKKRQLADSKYNERRAECEEAVKDLNQERAIKNLGQLSLADFEKIADRIGNRTVYQRARHVVSEDQRCSDAVAALKKGDMIAFGELMNSSHDSLRDDYEVTGIELDTLVEEARKIDGVLGSRMTGAGFGGCTVSLVREDKTEEFIHKVGQAYLDKIGLQADFYVADVGDGVKEISL